MTKQLELADDGRVIIRTSTQEWILRRPTLGEYRKLMELTQTADDRLREAVLAVPEGEDQAAEQLRISGDLQAGVGGVALYGGVITAFIELLAEGEPPDVDDLPAWAATSRPVARMIAHWRAVPLDLGPDVEGP